jgi:hypothetical protein
MKGVNITLNGEGFPRVDHTENRAMIRGHLDRHLDRIAAGDAGLSLSGVAFGANACLSL